MLDHLTLPEDDEEACYEIINTLVNECKQRRIAILGGETSIHNSYPGIEISICVFGHPVLRKENAFREGDFLIGLRSSGLHCNGFTKVSNIFGEEFRPEFVEPTLIYYDTILELIQDIDVNGMMHITGGAFTKLERILRNNDVLISTKFLKPQGIFHEIYNRGVSDREMYEIFNCGVGFVLSVSKKT